MNTVRRFDGKVADYDQYRERYSPDVLLPILRERCRLSPEWLIADIGAGTGMLSDVFLASGNQVVAVEPNTEMRQACGELHRGMLLQVVEGTAENTGLATASVDMVTAGR
ncbi:MAG TPA: methyltransferase domain-containing protein, partial [Edaphobacter sp.]